MRSRVGTRKWKRGTTSQQLTRMGIETNREIAGTETGLSVPSRVGENGLAP